MNVLFIGDPHLKINRFELAKEFLAWLNKLIAEQKPDLVVNLGDTFDTHAVLRSEVMNEFMNHVYKTLDMDIPYVYLVGNHDMYKPNDPKYHAMLPFKNKFNNLYVVDEVTELFGMTFVPYQHNASTFPRKTLPICVAHQTFIGANYGPVNATEGVDPQSVSGAEVVISGHIHTKSVLGQVRYVGSPFSQSAGDIDQIKGITIFNTDTYSERFYPVPLPTWRRLRLEVSEQFSLTDVHAAVIGSISNSKDHWVIELTGPKAELISYLGSTEYKAVTADINIKVKTTFTDKEKKKVSIEARSMEHIVSEFIFKVYNGSLDKAELTKTAKEVLNESRLSK